MRGLVAASVVAAAGVVVPSPAAASEPLLPKLVAYSSDRTAVHVRLGNGAEAVRFVQDASHLVLHGTGAGEQDDDCTRDDSGVITCEAAGVDRVYLSLRSGNDRLVTSGVTVRLVVDGGFGNDHLEGGSANDWILGGPGNDRLYGHGGADILDGQAGNDELLGGLGSDDLHGRDGTDTVNYAYSTVPISASIACGCAFSGHFEGGERDVIRPGVEVLRGSALPDLLVGDGSANRLIGGGGNDLLYGMGGDDVMPVDGNDWVFGGDGTDTATYAGSADPVIVWLDEKANDAPSAANIRADVEAVTGSRYDDVLLGNDRGNVLSGGAGDDDLVGFGGDDVLVGGPGRDSFLPGPGFDRCVGDREDANPGECEAR